MAITRRRSTSTDDTEPEESAPRRRRSSGSSEDEAPARRRRGSSSRSTEEDEAPARRRRGSSDEDSGSSRRPRRRGSAGFDSYSQKKRSNSNFADEFKPDADAVTLIKILDEGPFDTYNQHWIEEGLAKGRTRHSFICLDDEYFEDTADFDKGCPLCQLGEPASTYSLFNIIDLTNPRKPETKVWRTPPTVTDKMKRLAEANRTKPLNRVDLYFEVTKVQKPNKVEWDIVPVKADEVEDDYKIDALDADELATFAEKRFEDRTAIQKTDDYDALLELAESLD